MTLRLVYQAYQKGPLNREVCQVLSRCLAGSYDALDDLVDSQVHEFSFSLDGQYILSKTSKVIRLWDTQGNLLQSYPLDYNAHQAVFLPREDIY